MNGLQEIKELLMEGEAAGEVSAEAGLKLVAALEKVERFTFPTRKVWQGHIGTHYEDCFTHHPQCLAQLIAASVAGALA